MINDAENLSRLLGHLPPAMFRDFLLGEYGQDVPGLNLEASPKQQRESLRDMLVSLDFPSRQKLEEVAERIVLLTDGAGQDVVTGFREGIQVEAQRQAFDALANQYERALWLYRNDPALFKEALDARQADVFRQSVSCYSGFIAPPKLEVINDAVAREAFHHSVAQQLGCAGDAVAIQIFRRLRPDSQTGDDVDLYQISIHHNRPPEAVDCVQASELVSQEVIRAVSAHITYEPSNGHLEVLSKDTGSREAMARLVADALLQSPISGEKIPLKQYSYQCLAAPCQFDLTGENIASVKVTELGYTESGKRSLVLKIWATDAEDIYMAARSLISPTFEFRNHHLNYAKLAIRLKKAGKDRARTLTIILREDNKCNIKTKREKDRALCDRLLAKWQLVKEIGNASAFVDNIAA